MPGAQKITTFLWFDHDAEEAIAHYQAIFGGGATSGVARNGEAGPGTPGTFLVGTFELAGQQFIALNGGPGHPFTEAISLSIDCGDQKEVDYFWERLSEGGATSVCGWLKDKFGLSWQVVPRRLPELLSDPDAAKAARVMKAMMEMTKIDIAVLEKAAAG
jgi:predicted 3-demethylubiquinone-9 3-methyltransferase (glyoxalase superfamily)